MSTHRIHGQFHLRGLDPTGGVAGGAWMRDHAEVSFVYGESVRSVTLSGWVGPWESPPHSRFVRKELSLSLQLDSGPRQHLKLPPEGPWSWECPISKDASPAGTRTLKLRLHGVGFTNFLAFLGRMLAKQGWLPKAWREWLQPFRRQGQHRRWLIRNIAVDGDSLLQLDQAHSLFSSAWLLKHARPGINVIGWFHGYLGVGESARACARSCVAAGLPTDAVGLRLRLNGGQSLALWPESLAEKGKHAITIAHVDAPQSLDLARTHPAELKRDHYRIGYWAWELPEFPDHWIRYASVFHEIWCPSEFCRSAMAAKLPIPVQVMPHAIPISEAPADTTCLRDRFNLPHDRYLFLFSFDFNSYAPRKNPEAVIEAYRIAFADERGQIQAPVGLVLKMHGLGYDPAHREVLESLRARIPHLYVVDEALDREELTQLQYACDAFVSLHRSEGFGLGVAEMMAHGKPVISTNWSATSEFLDATRGCPVAYRLIELESSVGPYSKGQVWADAEVEDAARWMLRLAADPAWGRDLGLQAREWIRTRYSAQAIGQRYLDRIKAIALFEKPLY